MVINNLSVQEINVVLIALEKAVEELKKQIKELAEKVQAIEENH